MLNLVRPRFGLLSLLRFTLFAGAVLGVIIHWPHLDHGRLYTRETTLGPHPRPLLAVDVTTDGRNGLAVNTSGEARLFDLHTGKHQDIQLAETPWHKGVLSLSENARYAVQWMETAAGAHDVRVWDLETGQQEGAPFSNRNGALRIWKIACLNDGRVWLHHSTGSTTNDPGNHGTWDPKSDVLTEHSERRPLNFRSLNWCGLGDPDLKGAIYIMSFNHRIGTVESNVLASNGEDFSI